MKKVNKGELIMTEYYERNQEKLKAYQRQYGKERRIRERKKLERLQYERNLKKCG